MNMTVLTCLILMGIIPATYALHRTRRQSNYPYPSAPPYATVLYTKPYPPLQVEPARRVAEPHLLTSDQADALRRQLFFTKSNRVDGRETEEFISIANDGLQYSGRRPQYETIVQPSTIIERPLPYQVPYQVPMQYAPAYSQAYYAPMAMSQGPVREFSPVRGFVKGALEGFLIGSTMGLAGRR